MHALHSMFLVGVRVDGGSILRYVRRGRFGGKTYCVHV